MRPGSSPAPVPVPRRGRGTGAGAGAGRVRRARAGGRGRRAAGAGAGAGASSDAGSDAGSGACSLVGTATSTPLGSFDSTESAPSGSALVSLGRKSEVIASKAVGFAGSCTFEGLVLTSADGVKTLKVASRGLKMSRKLGLLDAFDGDNGALTDSSRRNKLMSLSSDFAFGIVLLNEPADARQQ